MWSQRLRFQGFYYSAPLLDFRTSKTKNRKSFKLTLTHQMEHIKTCDRDKYINYFSIRKNTIDENNDMAHFT